ncbi:MAG TPA: alpha/beta hydrolase fold domain-containing protein [Dokdonella sp.]|nr:alpha/beta hydrolase fold domain-containing protein [Dokdonella sp.]
MAGCGRWTWALAAWMAAAGAQAAPPTAPAQPLQGPGSALAVHAEVRVREGGRGERGWTAFTPAAPVPTQAPVIVFLHGWGALEPVHYRAWIDHLVQRGNIVIWPRYQDGLLTPGDRFLPNAVAGVRAALAALDRDGRVRPDPGRVAVVGHSAGGVLAAQLAAVAARERLPRLRAVMSVEPGDGSREGRHRASIPPVDLAAMPPSTLFLVVVGADDHWAGEQVGLGLYDGATGVPRANKNVLELQSDAHGAPDLIANHAAAGAAPADGAPHLRNLRFGRRADFRHAGDVDALDGFGLWKPLDALVDAAFEQRNREVALGGGPAQLWMGRWSDGVPVAPLRVLR